MRHMTALLIAGAATALSVSMPEAVLSQASEPQASEADSQSVALSDIDKRLMAAAAGTDKKAIRTLLEKGANIDARDQYGRTPLLIAIQNSPKSAIAKLLIKQGADVHVTDKDGNSAMHYAVRANSGQPPHRVINGSTIIKALIKAGAHPDVKNNAQQVPRDILLDKGGANNFAQYANPEKIRRSRLATLEDHMISTGLLSERTYPSNKLTFGRVLQAATAGTIGGGANQTRRSSTAETVSRPTNVRTVPQGPITCAATTYENLTAAEGRAILYAIDQDNRTQGRRLPKHCIQKIVARSKVPFRGSTLINYRIYRMYPRGYRTRCLGPVPDRKTNYWQYYEHTSQCNDFNYSVGGGRPIEAGGVRYEDGETTI